MKYVIWSCTNAVAMICPLFLLLKDTHVFTQPLCIVIILMTPQGVCEPAKAPVYNLLEFPVEVWVIEHESSNFQALSFRSKHVRI